MVLTLKLDKAKVTPTFIRTNCNYNLTTYNSVYPIAMTYLQNHSPQIATNHGCGEKHRIKNQRC